MKKIICILVGLMAASWHMKAQQVGMYNHYFYKPLFYNPAFAGSGEATEAMLINRSQWLGFNGGPQLNVFTIDGPLKEKKVGLGLNLVNDMRGINRRTGGSMSYSYRLNINEEIYVLLGLSAGIVNQSIDYSKVVSESANDLTLFSSSQQKTSFDGNAGFAFVWKGLELAASAPQLLGNNINYVDNSGIKTFYRQQRHYISSLKYKFALSEEKGLFITPQALVRLVPNAPLQYDGNLTFSWKNKCWLGATYKSTYAVSANVGICLYKTVDIGYSYEFITGNLAKYSGISHELLVNFKLGQRKKNEENEAIQAASDNKNAEYEHKLDSIHNQLEESQNKIAEKEQKIKELNAMLEQLKAQQLAQKTNGGTNYSNNPAATNNPTANQNPTINTPTTSQGNGSPNATTNPVSTATPVTNRTNGNPVTTPVTNQSNSSPNTTTNPVSTTTPVTNRTNGTPVTTPVANQGNGSPNTTTKPVSTTTPVANKTNANPVTTSATNQGNGSPNTNANPVSTINSSTTTNQSSSIEPGSKRVMEDNVWIIVSNAGDYKSASGATPDKGFYVVAGTFFYQDFAINEMKRFQGKGYKSTNWMYSNSKQYNYVYIKKVGTKQEAIKAAKEAQQSGVNDAWIKVLE